MAISKDKKERILRLADEHGEDEDNLKLEPTTTKRRKSGDFTVFTFDCPPHIKRKCNLVAVVNNENIKDIGTRALTEFLNKYDESGKIISKKARL